MTVFTTESQIYDNHESRPRLANKVCWPIVPQLFQVMLHIVLVPEVTLLVEALSREARSAADVEHHAGAVGRQGQQLQGALRHLTLDLHHAGAGKEICFINC